MEFDWDEDKRAKNIEEHEIDFEDVKPLFSTTEPYLDKEDDREDYGEERRIRLGHLYGVPLVVVYTMRHGKYRLISARVAEPAEEETLVGAVRGEKKLQQAEWEQEQAIEKKKKEERERISLKREREER